MPPSAEAAGGQNTFIGCSTAALQLWASSSWAPQLLCKGVPSPLLRQRSLCQDDGYAVKQQRPAGIVVLNTTEKHFPGSWGCSAQQHSTAGSPWRATARQSRLCRVGDSTALLRCTTLAGCKQLRGMSPSVLSQHMLHAVLWHCYSGRPRPAELLRDHVPCSESLASKHPFPGCP